MSFIGIDVAKATLDYACRPSGEAATLPNDDQGIRALVEHLRTHELTLIVLEATGGYEAAVVAALATAGLPVVVANPRQVRDFAQATGQLAKTDAIDAQVLALFAERVRPTPRPLPDAAARRSTRSSPADASSSRCSWPKDSPARRPARGAAGPPAAHSATWSAACARPMMTCTPR